MSVVDINTLEAVGLLNFCNEVILNCKSAVDIKIFMRVDGTFGKECAGFNVVALFNFGVASVSDEIFAFFTGFFVEDNDMAVFLDLIDSDVAFDLCDDSFTLRSSCLKEFFNTRKTLGNIFCGSDTAGMEGTHGKLGTGFTDGLCGDNTDSFTDMNRFSGCKVGTIAFCANAVFCLAVEDGTELEFGDACINDLLGVVLIHHLVFAYKKFAGFGMENIINGVTSDKTFAHGFDHLVAFADIMNYDTFVGSAVLFADDNFLGNVNKTSGKVTGVRGTECGIGKTFTRTTAGNEVFEDVKALTVVSTNRNFDCFTGSVGDKSAHTCKLTDLVHGTTSTGVCHHEDRVVLIEVFFKGVSNFVGGLVPGFDNFFVTFFVGHKTAAILFGNGIDLFLCFRKDLRFFRRNNSVAYRNGDCTSGGIFESLCFDLIENFAGNSGSVFLYAALNNFTELFFADKEADFEIEFMFRIGSVNISEVLRDRHIEDCFTDGGVDNLAAFVAVFVSFFNSEFDRSMKTDNACVISHNGFVKVAESFSFAGFAAGFLKGEIIGTEDHILGRNRNGFSVRRFENIVCSKHKESCLCLSFGGKRYVNCHLVAVEVGVVCSTYERMEFECAAFNKNGFKSLNTESVKSRRTVEHYRVILDNDLECVPNFGLGCSFDHFSCVFDVGCCADINKAFHNKRFEELDGHFFRKTALAHLEFRTNNDNGTSGIVNTFTEKVLAETSLFTFEHIGKGFEGTVGRSGYRTAFSAVVDKCVNCFLKHTFFVADDDIRSAEFKKSFKTVVSVDNSSVKIVEVGSCKSAAVKLDHRSDIRRNYRNNIEDHPFRTVSGKAESFDNFKTFEKAYTFLAGCILKFFMELCGKGFKVNILEKKLNSFGAHSRLEVFLIFFTHIAVFLLGKKLFLFERSGTGIGDNIACKIKYLFKKSGAHIKDKTHSGRDTFEVPDVRYGSCEFDMTHSLASYFCSGNFNAAAFADFAFEAEAFIFSAVALPVLGRSEDSFAEKTVAFRFECSVVDGFGFLYFAVGPFSDLFGRSKADFDRIKCVKFH